MWGDFFKGIHSVLYFKRNCECDSGLQFTFLTTSILARLLRISCSTVCWHLFAASSPSKLAIEHTCVAMDTLSLSHDKVWDGKKAKRVMRNSLHIWFSCWGYRKPHKQLLSDRYELMQKYMAILRSTNAMLTINSNHFWCWRHSPYCQLTCFCTFNCMCGAWKQFCKLISIVGRIVGVTGRRSSHLVSRHSEPLKLYVKLWVAWRGGGNLGFCSGLPAAKKT